MHSPQTTEPRQTGQIAAQQNEPKPRAKPKTETKPQGNAPAARQDGAGAHEIESTAGTQASAKKPRHGAVNAPVHKMPTYQVQVGSRARRGHRENYGFTRRQRRIVDARSTSSPQEARRRPCLHARAPPGALHGAAAPSPRTTRSRKAGCIEPGRTPGNHHRASRRAALAQPEAGERRRQRDRRKAKRRRRQRMRLRARSSAQENREAELGAGHQPSDC